MRNPQGGKFRFALDFCLDIEFLGQDIKVEFTAFDFVVDSTGIGSYEYCGCPGFDRGEDYVAEMGVRDMKVYCPNADEMMPVPRPIEIVIGEYILEHHGELIDAPFFERVQDMEDDRREYLADLERDRRMDENI